MHRNQEWKHNASAERKRLHINATCPVFAVLILEKPHNTVALEGETVTLACTISDPSGKVTWIKNNVALQAGLKYDLKKNAAFHQLRIHNLVAEDAGTYTCDTGDAQCDVTLTVEGKNIGLKWTTKIFLNVHLLQPPSIVWSPQGCFSHHLHYLTSNLPSQYVISTFLTLNSHQVPQSSSRQSSRTRMP